MIRERVSLELRARFRARVRVIMIRERVSLNGVKSKVQSQGKGEGPGERAFQEVPRKRAVEVTGIVGLMRGSAVARCNLHTPTRTKSQAVTEHRYSHHLAAARSP